MTTEQNTTEQPENIKDKETVLREAIIMAAEMDSAFKLYSYRCLSPDAFVSRAAELVQNFIKSLD